MGNKNLIIWTTIWLTIGLLFGFVFIWNKTDFWKRMECQKYEKEYKRELESIYNYKSQDSTYGEYAMNDYNFTGQKYEAEVSEISFFYSKKLDTCVWAFKLSKKTEWIELLTYDIEDYLGSHRSLFGCSNMTPDGTTSYEEWHKCTMEYEKYMKNNFNRWILASYK